MALQRSFPNCLWAFRHVVRALDLSKLSVAEQRAVGMEGTTQSYSLVKLVRATLGLDLDKQLQKSEWGERPLSALQLRYAATDAQVRKWGVLGFMPGIWICNPQSQRKL